VRLGLDVVLTPLRSFYPVLPSFFFGVSHVGVEDSSLGVSQERPKFVREGFFDHLEKMG